MDKLKMHTKNIADENYAALAKLFPNALTEKIVGYDEEGKAIIERAIDVDVLRQEISCSVVEGREERYQFTWPDKKKAMVLANAPITSTLRPCRCESVNFDETENLYIEGDNLEVLKLLHETYLEKIKLIYIDPPYNTGKDSFVYDDVFKMERVEYDNLNGSHDEHGNVLYNINVNNESNGRYHTDWLNMMYSRLKIARELLTDDGVIYISIDDNELENLRKLCNEIFGEQNFIANIIWIKKYGIQNDARYYSNSHDYIVLYAKNKDKYSQNLLPRTNQQDSRYKNPDNDPRGPWKAADFSVPHHSDNRVYEIMLPSGRKVKPSQGRSWGASEEELEKLIKDNRIWFGKSNDSVPSIKKFLSEVKDGITATTIWSYEEVGHTDKAKKELDALFDGATVFDYPKTVDLIKKIVMLSTHKDSIILDFFSGSSTTAHAVMKLNAEDGGCRKAISIQIPDAVAEKSMAAKNGYANICEVAKERIRRAGKKIGSESNARVDIGFRVLKQDTSNMKTVYYNPLGVAQQSLFDMTDNIKEDRTPEDLLFQVMLDLGVLLSSKIEEKIIAGKKVFNVADGFLIACFDNDITEETVKAVAQEKPYYAVFRDSSMANDSVATNFEQIFATYSPETVRKVL